MHQMRRHTLDGVSRTVEGIRPRAAVDMDIHKTREDHAPAQVDTVPGPGQFGADLRNFVPVCFDIGLYDLKAVVKELCIF